MCRKRGLDLRLFQSFRRGVPLNRPKPTELRERHDRGGLPAEVNHLVRLGRFRAGSRLHTHMATVPDNDVANPTARLPRSGQDRQGAAGQRIPRLISRATGPPYHKSSFRPNGQWYHSSARYQRAAYGAAAAGRLSGIWNGAEV